MSMPACVYICPYNRKLLLYHNSGILLKHKMKYICIHAVFPCPTAFITNIIL